MIELFGYYPVEIISFLDRTFEICEIRARVGKEYGVVFEIRTNEKNHVLPHVHAQYGKYSISIEIQSGKVFNSSLPKKQEKFAVEWVLEHKEKLMNDWNNIAISAISTMTQSQLDWAIDKGA